MEKKMVESFKDARIEIKNSLLNGENSFINASYYYYFSNLLLVCAAREFLPGFYS